MIDGAGSCTTTHHGASRFEEEAARALETILSVVSPLVSLRLERF